MEKTLTLKEMMEEAWEHYGCQLPLRLVRWIALENVHGHTLYIRPTRGTKYAED